MPRCPLYPQKRTSVECPGMSALCQKRTHALQQKAPSRIEFWVRSPAQARSAPSSRPARRRVLDAIGTGLWDCGRVWSNKLNGASFCQRRTCNFDYSKCVISTCLHRLSPMCRWRARYLNTRMSMR
jgi:hypothetical protein